MLHWIVNESIDFINTFFFIFCKKIIIIVGNHSKKKEIKCYENKSTIAFILPSDQESADFNFPAFSRYSCIKWKERKNLVEGIAYDL